MPSIPKALKGGEKIIETENVMETLRNRTEKIPPIMRYRVRKETGRWLMANSRFFFIVYVNFACHSTLS